jgi:hypothetical protein
MNTEVENHTIPDFWSLIGFLNAKNIHPLEIHSGNVEVKLKVQ